MPIISTNRFEFDEQSSSSPPSPSSFSSISPLSFSSSLLWPSSVSSSFLKNHRFYHRINNRPINSTSNNRYHRDSFKILKHCSNSGESSFSPSSSSSSSLYFRTMAVSTLTTMPTRTDQSLSSSSSSSLSSASSSSFSSSASLSPPSLILTPSSHRLQQQQQRKWSQISLCVGCGAEIYDQYILRVSPDLEWHASCLKCADCQQYLDESCTCFVRNGKTYCKRDYIRLFGAKCAKCSMCFSKTDLVMRARNKIYHVECFRCAICARQLTRGDEFVLKFDDLFCKADHEVVEKSGISSNSSTTSSSSSSLTPLTPVTPDCLKQQQQDTTNGSTPTIILGMGPNSSPLTVLNSSSTNDRMGSIPPPGPALNQMPLHPAGVIPGPGGDLNGHMNSSNISPSGGAGAPVHLSALSVVHLDHHTTLTGASQQQPQSTMPPSLTPKMNGAAGGGGGHSQPPLPLVQPPPHHQSATTQHSSNNNNSNSSNHHQHHHHQQQQQQQHQSSHSSSSSHHRSHRSSLHNSKNSDHKPTRVRTVLNEKQLHTLRSCYNANPRPDALMKEQLVEMTGLSPRVIRVWFQNKRCKDKKRSLLMKQIQQQEKDGRQLNISQMRGVPLIASSPVRHESPVQMNPIDVHSYQPPWKALAEYASMQSDIDPNASQFQHLVSQMHGYVDGLSTPNDASLSSLGGHGGPPTGPCTPMSYLDDFTTDQDILQPPSNVSSDISSPCTSE